MTPKMIYLLVQFKQTKERIHLLFCFLVSATQAQSHGWKNLLDMPYFSMELAYISGLEVLSDSSK